MANPCSSIAQGSYLADKITSIGDLFFHIVEAQGPILWGLNTLRKMVIFTDHQSVTTETIGIPLGPQNLARYDKKQVGSTANSQGAARPVNETMHTIPPQNTITPTKQTYVGPDGNNKSESFSE